MIKMHLFSTNEYPTSKDKRIDLTNVQAEIPHNEVIINTPNSNRWNLRRSGEIQQKLLAL